MKKHILKSFALLAMLFSALTLSAQSGVDWSTISWIGSTDATYNEKFKCSTTDGLVNIQKPFGDEIGIYMTFPTDVDLTCDLSGFYKQGAGLLLYLSSFTAQETQVVATWNGGSRTFWVYYADGTTGGSSEPETPDTEAPTLENVELFGAAQDFVLLTPTASDNKKVTAYLITPNGGAETEATLDDAGKIKISGLTMNTSYTYSVKAKDAAGNVSAAKEITFSTLDNVFCEEEVLPTNFFTKNQKLIFTARKLNDTQTLFEITSSTSTLTGVQNANIENAGGGGSSGDPKMTTWSLDNNTLSKTITWATYPTNPITMFVTALRTPGAGESNMIEFRYTIDVSQNCGIVSTDTEAPTNLIVTVDSYDHKSIVLAVSADDNEGVTSYKVVDTDNGIEEIMTPTDGKITLSNLSSGTTYNLTVTALDAVLNESAAVTVTVTTTLIQYCDYPTGHLNIADFGDVEGRCLLTLTKINDTKVRVIVKPNYAAGATRKLDYLKAISNGITAEIGSQVTEGGYDELCVDITYASAPAQYSFIIEWSGVNDGGTMWKVTPEKVSANNWCPLTEDLEKPEMLSASLVAGSETYNSVILAVSAKDNEEVANYRVVDNTYNYDEQFAPVDGKITLTGLTPAITYNFTVTAIDLSENESDNSITVSATTTNLEYCEWLTGHLGNANWGAINGRCLLTISKVTDKQLLVVVKSVSGANKLDFLEVFADGSGTQVVNSVVADELSVVLNFTNAITEIPLLRVLWSNENVDGNWMVELTNVKESYLCPHIELGESVDLSKLDLSAGVTTDVKITRKFVKGSGKWNTLSLPFGLDATDIATAFGSAKVVELSGATLVTSTDIDLSVSNVSEIVAGKPYLIQIPASYVPAVIENITLSNTVTAQETATANGLAKMVSVLTPIAFDDAAGGIRFFLNTNGKLSYRSTTNGIMNPYRAYFVFPHINDPATAAQVRARVVFNENEATGLDQIVAPEGETIKAIVNGQLIIIRGGVKYNVQGQKL